MAWCAVPAWAADLYVYPAKGQGQDQLEKDKYECYQWARRESGLDPMATPRTSTPPPLPQARQGGVARGGIAGGVVGAIAGDTKKGLTIGAASGGVLGGARRGDQERQEQQGRQTWEQEETARYTQNRDAYNRAYTACLSGRGYTVQ